jgi:hypothetical protein
LLGAGNVTVIIPGTPCASNQYRNAAGTCVQTPACPSGQRFNLAIQSCGVVSVRAHAPWPKGRAINPKDWSRSLQYRGHAAFADLSVADQNAMKAKALALNSLPSAYKALERLNQGVVAFKVFDGADGTKMGAFFDSDSQTLKIIPIPPHKKGRKSAWGKFTDAVGGAIDYASDKLSDAAHATGDFLSDLWDSVSEQAVRVYNVVKEYGCAVVGSDLVVALAATGAGIVASPAASAAVVSGAAAGRTGCALIEVGELVYAILKLLSRDFPQPPAAPPPPEGTVRPVGRFISNLTLVATSMLPTRAPAAQIVLGPPRPSYKRGSIARFNVTRGVWSIYSPLAGVLGCGACARGLGEDEVNPPVPVGFVKTGEELAPPADVAQGGQETDKTPLYKNPYFWLAVGGAVAVAVAGGGYYLVRRRRKNRLRP